MKRMLIHLSGHLTVYTSTVNTGAVYYSTDAFFGIYNKNYIFMTPLLSVFFPSKSLYWNSHGKILKKKKKKKALSSLRNLYLSWSLVTEGTTMIVEWTEHHNEYKVKYKQNIVFKGPGDYNLSKRRK